MGKHVYIFDTTLRDGEQSPGATMNIQEKIRIARQLENMGVDIIEAGFPISSEGDYESVRAIAKALERAVVAGLARANREDIDRAWDAVRPAKYPRIHTFIATSDIHLKHKLKMTREEVLRDIAEAVSYSRKMTDDVEFSAEDATRTDLAFLCEVVRVALKAGATTINIPDTVGYTVPTEYAHILDTIRKEVEGIDKIVLSVHCHNDLGLATSNSIMAIQHGARQVECTVNGIGERAGNTAMEEVVMALRTRPDLFPYETGINTKMIYPTSRLVSQITGMKVQPNKAIVGANAFAHEAGIHQDGVLKEKLTYEIMTPESVGIPKSSLVMGKHSGRHAFRDRLKSLGFDLNTDQIQKAFELFKALADKKKTIYDEDIVAIVMHEVLRIPYRYRLNYLNIVSGTSAIPTAVVTMEIDGESVRDVDFGDGPVDAAMKTIKKMTRSKSKLRRFAVNAITGGTDAQGEVTVHVEEDGISVMGQGAHTDIIVASAKAYINALNKLEYQKAKKREEASRNDSSEGKA
jgi:2-isopropylmalate synthase